MIESATAMLKNQGLIETIDTPAGWKVIEEHTPDWASPAWLTYGPDLPKDVELTFYDRGRPLTGSGQDAFRSVLNSGSKQLSNKTLETLFEILRDACLVDAFNFLHASAQTLNGKKVLVVEGRWNEMMRDRYWIFVPSDQSCEYVQEIWYQAPIDAYPIHLKFARQAINSIKWK